MYSYIPKLGHMLNQYMTVTALQGKALGAVHSLHQQQVSAVVAYMSWQTIGTVLYLCQAIYSNG